MSLGGFYVRRARRLLPALFVLLAGVTVYTALFRRDALGALRGDVVAALTYTSNWYQIWVGQGYTAAGDFAPLRHLWSLAVEEQYYLIWPVVMILMLRVGRRRLPDLCWALILAAFAVTAVTAIVVPTGPVGTCDIAPDQYWQVAGRCISKIDTLYLSTPTRATGLLLGGAFALIWRPNAVMRGPLRRRGAVLDLAAIVGLVALGALAWTMHIVTPEGADLWLFRGGFLLTDFATLFVIAAVTHRRAAAGPALGNVLLVWIGTRSYGLYLYHWPIYQGIRRVSGNPLTVTEFVAGDRRDGDHRRAVLPVRRDARAPRCARAGVDAAAQRRQLGHDPAHGGDRRRRRRRPRRRRRRQPGDGAGPPERDPGVCGCRARVHRRPVRDHDHGGPHDDDAAGDHHDRRSHHGADHGHAGHRGADERSRGDGATGDRAAGDRRTTSSPDPAPGRPVCDDADPQVRARGLRDARRRGAAQPRPASVSTRSSRGRS